MRSTHRLSLTSLLTVGCLVLALPTGAAAAEMRTVTDGAGRTVEVPVAPQRVYTTSPIAVMMLYSLAPEKMVGWNYKLGKEEARYILPSVRDLPALGGWFGETGKGNRETLLAARPDLILSIGTSDRTAAEFADRLQQQVGVPVYVHTGTLAGTAETYETIGALLGVFERAAPRADYARRALAHARAFMDALPPERRLTVYYAEGLRGLQSDSRGSLHTEPLDFLGIENVAGGTPTTGFGRMSVSLDQVIAWKPEVILVCPEKQNPDGSWVPEWLGDPSWSQIPAVASGRVFLVPGAPFNWFDRPPSAARLLGLKWILWSLWEDRVDFDMAAETREFYRLFYHYELSETEAREILEASRQAHRAFAR